ncbi:MAG: DUF1330 domain-containing protein [Gemmatimonadetes bacterium]|nr:DUF1330 domain-containing protein [Gemmatimonadota bacterium]
MPAYFIAEVEVLDPTAFQEYVKGAPATVAQYGGTYIARGGAIEVLEGSWAPKRLTIIRFDSMDRVREWFNSPEYAPLKEIRKRTTRVNLLMTDGL